MMFIWSITTIVLFLFQYVFNIPQGWVPGYFFPFEDISSFGSIAVALFAFALARQRFFNRRMLIANFLAAIALLALVAASWSRATWLAALVAVFSVALARLKVLWTLGIMIILVLILLVVTDRDANGDLFNRHPYIWRLITLVRIENPVRKSSGRIDLYWKALNMITAKPLVGHGIGSFYMSSRNYARPGDSKANVPDFAHNTFLEVAAEEGLPAASIFAALCLGILSLGFSCWRSICRVAPRKCKIAVVSFWPETSNIRLTILAPLLALAVYLETQLTANSLNVYVSNQFFFWFLMAAVLVTSKRSSSATCAS